MLSVEFVWHSDALAGINPAVINRDREAFGADADDFKPERWLQQAGESKDAWDRRRSSMDNATFTFGYGSRSCLGRHIAILEIYKLIATLFSRYEMKLAQPDREWTLSNQFFIQQSSMDIDITRA